MSVLCANVWCPQGLEEGIASPGTGLIAIGRHVGAGPGPGKERPVLSPAEPSPAAPVFFFFLNQLKAPERDRQYLVDTSESRLGKKRSLCSLSVSPQRGLIT